MKPYRDNSCTQPHQLQKECDPKNGVKYKLSTKFMSYMISKHKLVSQIAQILVSYKRLSSLGLP